MEIALPQKLQNEVYTASTAPTAYTGIWLYEVLSKKAEWTRPDMTAMTTRAPAAQKKKNLIRNS